MKLTTSRLIRYPHGILAGTALLVACADEAPVAPKAPQAPMQLSTSSTTEVARFVATIRRVTSRYHDLQAALDDGFVFLHDCETRAEEGAVGIIFGHPGRVGDGIADPEAPDALIYEPRLTGSPRLVGVELAVPVEAPDDAPPTFLGHTFQREDEFGVFALHVWVWRRNPAGLFAVVNPRVSCEAGDRR